MLPHNTPIIIIIIINSSKSRVGKGLTVKIYDSIILCENMSAVLNLG